MQNTKLIRRCLVLTFCWFLLAAPAMAQDAGSQETYDQDEVLAAAESFFGEGAEGLAKVVEKIFAEQGRPNGTIAGEEISGAVGVGLRYGKGTLRMKAGAERQVFWTGPSIGFDAGGNASKVFVLVYRLDRVENLFQRFPGVDGSAYWIGGVGANYQRSGDIVLAPIRLGVGLRFGANIGYMNYTRKRTWNPF
ncbi:MAG: DUF1134 domain-containing protein [Gammaproteobacteria bacterium]|nr:DUF1134 domain-containing protein [Gammaproteobacteria bacterium]